VGSLISHALLHILPVTLGIAVLVPVGAVVVLLALLKRRKPQTGTGEVLDATEQRITLVDVHALFAAALEVLRKRR
jgi:hypothetical protein